MLYYTVLYYVYPLSSSYIHIYISIPVPREIYYKETAHPVMEAEKSKIWQVGKLEAQESWWFKFQSESESEGRRRPMSQADSQAERANSFVLNL